MPASWLEPASGESVVDRDLISEGHYPKISAAELRNHSPEPVTIVLLGLDLERPLNNGDAPLAA
jgi:hypothetical protein